MPFIEEAIEPGSAVHTDGWLGCQPVKAAGYDHGVTILKGKKKTASELMPRSPNGHEGDGWPPEPGARYSNVT